MSSNADMHPYVLTFKDPEVEAAYQRYVLLRHFRSDDLRFFFVTTFVMFGLSMKTVQEQDMELLAGVPYLVCGLLNVAFWYVYMSSSLDRRVQIRPYISVIMRLCIASAGSWAGYSGREKWIYGLAQYKVLSFIPFLMATETFGNLPYAFGVTTDFKLHLPSHLLTYFIFLTAKARVVADNICRSEGALLIRELESKLDTFFEIWIAGMKSTVGYFTSHALPKEPCLHSTVFVMTYFSMGFVSYSLWKWEKRTRLEFAAGRSSHSRLMSGTDGMMHLTEAFVLITTAAVFWTYSTPLTRMLQS